MALLGEWRKITQVVPGDYVHRWGEWLEVIKVTRLRDGKYTLTILDNGEEKEWEYEDYPDYEYSKEFHKLVKVNKEPELFTLKGKP